MERFLYFVQRGLWEVLDGLYNDPELQPEERLAIEKLLWNIAANKKEISCCTPLIQNATQIRWLAISLLSRVRPITSTEADSLSPAEVDSLKSEVEFEYLLHHVLPPETSSVVLEEIISLHSKVLHAGRAKSGVSCLSAESYTCLRECLLTDPVGANSMVQQLLCLWCPHFSETDNQLQDLYKEVLWLCIQGIEISAQGSAPFEREKYQNKLLCLVSVLQVSEEKQHSLSEWLATRLLSLCESELVPPQLVYLVLVSRGKLGFLRALIGLENDRRDRSYQGHNVAVMERLCSRLAGESCTEELFYRVVCMKRHWVEDLVSWCSEIVICGKSEIVQTLLSGPGLSVLWPVVLLHTYNQFANREQIFDSLNFLIAQCKSSMALQDATVALEREITLVQWCKQNNPSLTLDNRHLLALAKRHSTLETLRQTCNLATLPWTDVRSLLDTQGGSAPDSTTSNWDVVTFDGFCILMLGFNIILSASEIENLSKKLLRSREWPPKCNELINLMNPIISARFTHIDPAVNEQSTHDMSREDKSFSPTQQMYSEQVTKKLQTMKEMICKLFPLTYRIEVLENLFALLFLRHEHFESDSSSDSGGENEEPDTVRKSLEVSPQDSNSTQPKTSNQNSVLTMDHLKNFEDLNVFFPLDEIPMIKSQVSCSVPIADLNIMASSSCQKVADTKSDKRLASQPSASEMSYPSSENMSSLSSSFLSSAMFISMSPSTELRGGVQEEIPTRNSLQDQPNILLDSKRRPRRVRRTRVHNSSGVSDSSVSSSNDGFVCNKYVVRDLLHCLKECLVNSSVAFYNSRSQQDHADKMTHVPSSVSLDTLQHRMNRLSQYASEASWRLQLLTDPHFIGEVGQVPAWGLLPETEQSPWIYLSESTASDSDDESHRDTMPCNKRPPRRRGQSDTDKSSSSGSRSISGGTTAAPKRKGSQSRSQRVSLPSTRHNIINLMLSSHTNLAIRCLTHGDYIKAKDAIKKFDEEDNPLVAEVKFTEASLSLRKRLQACIGIDKELGDAKLTLGHSQYKTSTENSIFKSLRQVAAVGVQTTSLSSLVETFLSVTPLQTIPVTDTESRLSGSLLECADNSQAITVLDLAFTFGTTFQHSASLLDVACRHCDRLQGDSKKGLGFVGFTRNMIHLLKEANMESNEPRGELPSNISVSRLLGCSYLPLSVRQLREHKEFWKELDDSLRQFQLALEQSEGAAHSPSRSTRMNKFHEAKPHGAFKRLLRVFANNVLYKDSDGPSYLYYLYIYLKSLSSLLVQFLPETDKQIPRTYFDILGESVVSIIGRLVFDHDVPPSQLEGVTSKLKLDLVQLVIQNCCPVIPDTPPPLPFQGAASNEWGRMLLNKAGMEKNGEARHPELCVRTLLSDLLTLIKDNLESSSGVLTVERATMLANDSNVQALLASTSEIVAVDLTLLSPGVETLAFLANLTNLMWIHALLTLETSPREVKGGSSDTNFGLVSKSAMCRLMSMQCVGYTVGALGFVSLFELLNTLLGPDLALSSPSLLSSVAQHGRSTHHEDLWDRFTVSSDPRFLFALTNGHKYSPKVQVLHANNMDEQLDRCMLEYVNHFIAVEVMESGTRLLIPPLIQSYHEFVLVNQEPESHTMMPDLLDREDSSSISRREKFSLLLEFLRDNSSGEQRSRLYDSVHSLTASNMVVSLKSSYMFSITLEYTNGSGVEISAAEALLADTEEDMWDKRVLQEPVVKFLEQHCWLLAVLVQKIHQDKSLHASPVQECSPSSSLDRRTWCLEQLCCAPWVQHLQPMFGGNATLAALHTTPPPHLLWAWFEQLASDNKWQCCADTLWALPEALLLQDTRLQMFNDTVMAELAATIPNSECPMPWWYCQHIGNICTQAKCILANMCRWPVEECIFALRVLMESECRKLPEALETQVREHLRKMLVYKKILSHFKSQKITSWFELSYFSENDPSLVMDYLLESELCLEWAELHDIPTRAQHLIDSRYFMLLLQRDEPDLSTATKLLHSLPFEHAKSICDSLLVQLTSLPSLKFVISLLLNCYTSSLGPDALEHYKMVQLGVEVLSCLPGPEQSQYLTLIGQPLLVLEELIMNTHLELLERVLASISLLVSPRLRGTLDDLLRKYAGRALDMGRFPNQLEERLDVSLAVSELASNSGEFVMPDTAPQKSQWMRDEEVTECKCCRSLVFSMFNRRHHCRRCGRVVCAACSTRRMQVSGYGDVSVRVCDDCYSQTVFSEVSSRSIESKSSLEAELKAADTQVYLWRLNTDVVHNSTVREEFSYEYAPSVSLCLAILKLHSDNLAYPRFLLNSCKYMMQRLWHEVDTRAMNKVANTEVDYNLVIQMVRSLALAAKVKYSQLGSSVAECDRLLSEADVLTTLVQAGCADLIPVQGLNDAGLRVVRDLLVDKELWLPAMDVSTKAGLDKTGVWAAWGKACLRAGCWREARDRFSHCLEPGDPRPARNPPLLNDIVQILVTGAYNMDPGSIEAHKSRNTEFTSVVSCPAVLHTLASLKDITRGIYPQTNVTENTVIIGPKLDSLFYAECQYYLSTYGSHAGILAFYLQHDDLAAALRHVFARKLDPEIFYNIVYIPCLRHDMIADLHLEMTLLDSSLDKWKPYLCHVCLQLERRGLLNVLYQLQLFMKDNVRAAMSCIRFYKAGARSYSDLATNLRHLHLAQKHLEDELATGRWGNPDQQADMSTGLSMKLKPWEVNQHISTILRQMEVNKFLHICEIERRPVLQLAAQLFPPLTGVPTLFGSNSERLHLAVLVVLCGKNVEEAFGLAFRIIQDYHLKAGQVFCLVGSKLASDNRIIEIEQLIGSIQSSGTSDPSVICDEVLGVSLQVLAEKNELGAVEPLVRLITDLDKKISAYINCRQLKSAYLLAVKNNRLEDVRRILHEAEQLGQTKIQHLCMKKLEQEAHT